MTDIPCSSSQLKQEEAHSHSDKVGNLSHCWSVGSGAVLLIRMCFYTGLDWIHMHCIYTVHPHSHSTSLGVSIGWSGRGLEGGDSGNSQE